MSIVPSTSAAVRQGLAGLRRELAELGFTDARVKQRFGLPASDDSLFAMQRPLLDFRASGDDEAALDVLMQLFIVGCAVQRKSFERILSAAGRATLLEAQLVQLDGEQVRATVALVPWRDLLVTSDRVDHMFDPEYVLFHMGELLLADGYRAAPKLLSATGRFLFTHQARVLPAGSLERLVYLVAR